MKLGKESADIYHVTKRDKMAINGIWTLATRLFIFAILRSAKPARFESPNQKIWRNNTQISLNLQDTMKKK
jgi:hypothetical protein